MIDLLISIGTVGAVGLAVGWWGGQMRGKANERAKRDAETLEGLERGREAIGHGRASGATPDERLRLNDSQW